MNEIEAYSKLTELLNELQPYSIDLTLDRIKVFLDKIGNPQNSFKSIIVGGTNGKGSICQFLSDAFIDAGIKTGIYTSPHLFGLNERFRINNRLISYRELFEKASYLKNLNDNGLTYFEFLTALAFEIFKQEKVEVAILEVGMGGEFDATNVVNPILSVIAKVSLDHTEHLGNTHAKIAETKAKIIKSVGVVGKNGKTVIETIKRCAFPSAELFFVDDFYINKAKEADTLMRGIVSKENLATALLSIDVLNRIYGYNIRYKALKRSFWQGRFEIIKSKNKTFIFDGAHNKNAILKLIVSLKNYNDKFLIFSALKSKDWQNNLKLLEPHFERIILTPIHEHRLAVDVKEMESVIKNKEKSIIVESVNSAIIAALRMEAKTVVVTGSLYLIAEAKACRIYDNFIP